MTTARAGNGNSASERLQRLLGDKALRPLRRRLRRHFERSDPARMGTQLRLGNLAPCEYEVLSSLMGRPLRISTSIQVDIPTVDAALAAAGLAPSLRAALEDLDGAIVHGPTARAEATARWSAVALECGHDDLATLLASAHGAGLLKRLARGNTDAAARLRDSADRVLARLPEGGIPRAQLAAETLGDAHGLDNGAAVASLVLAVLRQAVPHDGQGLEQPADERVRAVWAKSGVLVNELARPALVLNLPIAGRGYALAGEAMYLSLRTLVRRPPEFALAGAPVFVCENPNIVAIAADQLGARCKPLVCTEGMPAAAQRTLLSQLAATGAEFVFHGDFDWPGVRIANHVMNAFHALPWRMGTADYVQAATTQKASYPLTGTPTSASWDASLEPAMRAYAIAIAEESVAKSLLTDLRI